MPSITFEKLAESKRTRFLAAALSEFAQNNFETASINRIIKSLGIARGSVYQYFEDKVDLWLFLKTYAENLKLAYIQRVKREDYPDFWSYYEAVYASGIDFHIEQPEASSFLYRVGFWEHSEAVRPYLNDWNEKAEQMLTQWVLAERDAGTFGTSISTEMTVHFLRTMSQSVAELIQKKTGIDFGSKLKAGEPIIAQKRAEISEAIHELVVLMKRSLG